jgi:hypothetical protein
MTAVVSNAPQSSSQSKKPDWLHHATAVGLTFARSLDETVVAPGIVAERSRLLALLSQAVRAPSAWKFSKVAQEAHRLGRCGLAAVRRSTEARKIDAMTMLTVGSETLASTLMRASALSQGN